MGKPVEALAAAEKESDEVAQLSALPCIYWATGRRAESDTALRTFEVKYGGVAAFWIATVHACRGEPVATIDWLERAYRQRDGNIILIKRDPSFRPLHRDPRFQALMQKLNLPVT